MALYVCHESRDWAMRRYKLAFGGTDISLTPKPGPGWYQSGTSDGKEKWYRNRMGEKTWVDFENDIFALSGFWQHEWYRYILGLGTLQLLEEFCPKEFNQIRRLIFRGNHREISMFVMEDCARKLKEDISVNGLDDRWGFHRPGYFTPLVYRTAKDTANGR
jgi:hypothetical protein